MREALRTSAPCLRPSAYREALPGHMQLLVCDRWLVLARPLSGASLGVWGVGCFRYVRV